MKALFASLLALSLASQAGAQGPSDEAAALATVQDMFKAMRTKDSTLMRSLFEPGARLSGIRTRADGTTFVQSITLDQWVQFIARDPRPDWTERSFEPRIQVEGTLAQIWAEYDFHLARPSVTAGLMRCNC